MLLRFVELWKELSAPPVSSGVQTDSLRKNNTRTAHNAVETALSELTVGVQQLDNTLHRARADKERIATTLREYQAQTAALHERAKAAVQARNDAAATEYLEEQRAVEDMMSSYKRIEANINATLRRLQEQHRRMVIQREEILAQRTIIEMQLASARTQEEFVRNIQAIGLSHEALEQEVLETQVQSDLRDELQKSEHTLRSAIDHATHHASAQESRALLLDRLNAELEAERQQQQRLEEETLHKRFRLAFLEKQSEQQVSPPKNAAEPHQNLIHQHLTQQHLTHQSTNQELLRRFFDTPSASAPSAPETNSAMAGSPEPAPLVQEPSSKEEMLKKFFER
ncbi:MAG: hypothetical protein EAZ92_14495 [Candidatus Kapaibacterium sp.]|nr:MAG: hypothetical protein EAZ92_14495 [Candidatus Kapabacteria bacterium]